jgi:hypothetical protein
MTSAGDNMKLNPYSIIAVALLAVTALAAASINYHLANTYKFAAASGGREYFDYITFDPGSRRLYLTHGTEVLVVNADTGAERAGFPD